MKKIANFVTGTAITMMIIGTASGCSGAERSVELIDALPVENTAYTVTDYSYEFETKNGACDVVISVSGICKDISGHRTEDHVIYTDVFERQEFAQMKTCMASSEAFSILAVLYDDDGKCLEAQTYFIENSTNLTEFNDIEFVFSNIPDNDKFYLELKI